jgi:hypothetical protein
MHRSLIGRGRSSGVEHNLAKVGVEGSNPFARSNQVDFWLSAKRFANPTYSGRVPMAVQLNPVVFDL